jgi:2-polyprenyl-6-methoxyphenol hydroxylase-like FAD-dependent oxidoreductase
VPAVNNALVVGGGAAGTAVAILLAEAGVEVDLIELKPEPTAAGSGITLQGNALRVLRQLGVWDNALASGYPFDSLGLRAPDPQGTLVAELPDVKTGGPDLPAALGMPRPVLARILIDRTLSAGAKVRFGTTFTQLSQDCAGVDVTFSDGSGGRYDVIVGADGVRSWTRRALGINLETKSVGMGIWRAFGPRPANVTRTDLYYGGPSYIAGYCPTGKDSLYAYIVEKAQDRSTLTPEQQLQLMRELAQAYHGPWDDIREHLTDPSRVNYTWFETHVLDAPGTADGSWSSAMPRTPARRPSHREPHRRWRTPRCSPNCSSSATPSTRTCGPRSMHAASPVQRLSSTHPTSSPNGSSNTSRATSPD